MPVAPEQLHVLIIEDDFLQHQLLSAFISSVGYRVEVAESGAEALALFRQSAPDVVLLDYELPDMSGKEIVQQLRQLQTEWLPILFLSAHSEIEVQRDCLLAGGDDYITKPLDFTILEAKIQALSRLALMQRKIRQQKTQLEAHIAQEEREASAALYLYERLITSNENQVPECQQLLIPATQFSGDMICTSVGTNGHRYLLLADATGHGLSAAIGLIPVTQVFHSMTRKGHHISTIAREMNRQIRLFTPSYRFVAAVLIEIDPFQLQLDVWNGGMPTGLLCRQSGLPLREFRSRHVALGLSSANEFHADVDSERYQADDRLLFFSDGLTDACNADNQVLGSAAIAGLAAKHGARLELAQLQEHLSGHLQGQPAQDDVAIILATLPSASCVETTTNSGHDDTELTACELQITLHDQLIPNFDLLPMAIEWLRRVGFPEARLARLHTVMMELVTNAIDHGLLRLDSKLKEGPDGFLRYLNERQNRVLHLNEATLRLTLSLHPESPSPFVRIQVSDSGAGFDVSHIPAASPSDERKGGRGLQLVRSLAANVHFNASGNAVSADIPL
ncbi:SpoIIE family protein phosphatase [Permianibacter sp. IMCC34836]|uniref:SpoIIE family protein phosphatase n=1 Tax=Permianibacter fluminis TaxID=2738515 RepID=UPI0015518135|nr:SpoIIE family protein phosphatase [Permianibacter fluminis]NQD36601.1 SpoIIE family protein phosphatase [Permianibacter fluminis]